MVPMLFQPLQLRGITLKNRIVVSPMCQYSGNEGFANNWHLVHLGSRATGGAGLVFTEAVAVSPEGRISPYDLGLWHNDHINFLRQITSFITSQGSVPGIQLAHAGRKASVNQPWAGDRLLLPHEGGWKTVAPSPIPFSDDKDTPGELSVAAIETIVQQFGMAAARALEAGFEVLELHGAHGYLINEFLSPLTNVRTDEYGGSYHGRTRFLREVIAAVRAVWPAHLPLFLRISATDWADGGWTTDDSLQLASEARDWGVDLIDCSTGGVVSYARIPARPGYQVPYAEAVRKVGIPTGAVGIIVTAQQAEDILQQGQADLIFRRDYPLDAI
ncbi:MAG: NADH:flavin oxidoreductase/NADH oxidase, partial [Chitinophagia bacterium]|nr:NADH:flavin oxidoreductase/NADH oxidase [Chitinophagia bacterium]